MELPVPYPGFEGRGLAIKRPGLYRGFQLLCDGAPVTGKRGVFTLKNNSGEEVQIKLGRNIIDPIPKVTIGGEVIQVARPLSWVQYGWACLPLVLFYGGALGGGLAVFAAYTNLNIFRSDRGEGAKYGLAALVTAGAIGVYVVVVLILATFIVISRYSS